MRADAVIVSCNFAEHGSGILAILNEAIVTSTALYDYQPRSDHQMKRWFETKVEGRLPVLGMVNDQGTLLGFATYGSFRAWPAYKYTVEHSVYVHSEHRGAGVGARLLESLIDAALSRDVHAMVGVVDTQNAASCGLHAKLGFQRMGTLKEVGFKFGQWLDVAFYQKVLPTPTAPNEK
jgi:L-amino acid N-acyltransferase